MKTLPSFLTIEVTQKDITNATPRTSRACPIARAANRALRKVGFLNNCASASVVILSVFTRRADRLVGHYRLDENASSFVRVFDDGRMVEPFTFVATLLEGNAS